MKSLFPKAIQKEETAFPSCFFLFFWSDRQILYITQLFVVRSVAKCYHNHGRQHTNADMNPKVTSLDGLSWSSSGDLKNEKLKNKPNKFPQIFKGSWKTWLAGI